MASNERNNERLKATKNAYWENSDKESLDFYAFYDGLSQIVKIKEPTTTHVGKVFMMLPSNIFGKGVAWTFSDSEVSNDIFEFIDKNKERIKQSFLDN